MARLLDDVDIVNQRLKSEVDKLEKELTILRERHLATHDNLKECRDSLKSMEDLKHKHVRLEKDYNFLLNVLQQISSGEIQNPALHAKQKLEDL